MFPSGGFYTQVSAPHVPVTCNRVEQTLSTELYSTVRRKEKTPMICKAIWLVGLLHLQEALLSMRPYIRFLLTAALVHYLTILCKHLYYFQAGGKQSDFHFFIFQRPDWDSKPPPLSPGLSAVQGPPNPKTTMTVGPERARTHDKRVTSLPSIHTQVCARDNKSMTCLASYATASP